MRRAVALLAAGVALAGPTLLAFFSGGYFDGALLVAAIVAWTLVLVAALVSPRPLPSSTPGRVTIAGLGLICTWSAVSLVWAPLADPATDSVVRLLLYLAALVAAAALLSERPLRRAVEPVLAAGSLVVIGYGLAGRLLPGLVELEQSARAGDRLYQPITYWNAEGALAAMGLVLCARLAGDRSRGGWTTGLAGAACAPLGAGLYLSYSRGAVAAAAVGLGVLLAVAPSRSQLRAIAIALGAAAVAAAASAAFPGVANLAGSLADRERDGALMLVVLLLVMLSAAAASAGAARADRAGRLRVGRLAAAERLPAVVAALVALTIAGLVVGGLRERGGAEQSFTGTENAGRLTTLKSRRYDYWRLGARAFAENPFGGLGAAGYRVFWRRERPVKEGAIDVHSLPLEFASELGVVGLAALGLFLGGALGAGRRALRKEPGLLAGGAAAGSVWLVHASFDWDWQVPAVTLPAIVIVGALIAGGEDVSPSRKGSAA